MLESRQRGPRYGPNGSKHARVVCLQKRLCRSACNQGIQLGDGCYQQQSPQLRYIAPSLPKAASGDRRKERARVAAPLSTGGVLASGHEAGREHLDVVDFTYLGKGIPFPGTRLKRIEDHVVASLKTSKVPAVGIRNDCLVTPFESTAEELLNGRRLAGAGRTDQLEVLRLVQRCERHLRQGPWTRVGGGLTGPPAIIAHSGV